MSGATSAAPHYGTMASGSIYAEFYCPDATTCLNVQPQLLYTSASASQPWTVSVPLSWDLYTISTQWSFVGVDDGDPHQVVLNIFNEGSSVDFSNATPTTFSVDIYTSAGALVGSGTTPPIPPTYEEANGDVVEGGAYSVLLDNVPGDSFAFAVRRPQGVDRRRSAILGGAGCAAQ